MSQRNGEEEVGEDEEMKKELTTKDLFGILCLTGLAGLIFCAPFMLIQGFPFLSVVALFICVSVIMTLFVVFLICVVERRI